MTNDVGNLSQLVAAVLGAERADAALAALVIDPALRGGDGVTVSRAEVAMALNVLLFSDLLDRAPTGAAYVAGVVAQGGAICFDHGALRTIDGPTGALPRGYLAFARLLEPLGYRVGGLYPLPRLTMTGRAYVHQDLPESIPQFFVSELHIDQLAPAAQVAANAVFGASRDPIGTAEQALLDSLARDGRCDFAVAVAGLPGLFSAFGRQHEPPQIADYEALLPHSAEGAWIATEGNAFNHATDRVADVKALAEALRARGMPIKDVVEESANGRVFQTAFRADKVMRTFRTADGGVMEKEVPGSFYEFITRAPDPATGGLDLTFDSGNATGIFAVTRA